jgi:hypothetical protein
MSPTATKPKIEKVRFEAGLLGEGVPLKITVKKTKEVFGESGRKEAMLGSGVYIHFQSDGLGGQFYETTDPAEIELLRAKVNGDDPHFFEVPIPVPASAPVLAEITKLAVRGDVDALVALAQEEEDTHQRQDVIDTIADALEQIK